MLLFLLLYFNPRAFIKSNVVTVHNKSLTDVVLGRQPRVTVLHRSPIYKLIKKQAAFLGIETDIETRGRQFEVDGECSIVEQKTGGYKLEFSDNKEPLWAPNITAGYICGDTFYTSPHPATHKEGNLLGTIVVMIVGTVVSFAVIVPNFMDFLIYKEVSTEKTKKYKKFAYGALIIGSAVLAFVSFVATDIVLEIVGAPHIMTEVKEKCYVVSNYLDIFEAKGNNTYSKNMRKAIKNRERTRLSTMVVKMLSAGLIQNSSNVHRLASAGLLATTEEPFVQQASMRLVDADSRLYHFTVPCGTSIVNMDPGDGAESVRYEWRSNIYFSSQVVKATFIDTAISYEYKWCRNLLNNKKTRDDWLNEIKGDANKDAVLREAANQGFDAIIPGKREHNWAVWAWECGASRMHGKCFYGYKWSPAGNFYMRRVYRNGDRYLKRCSIPEGKEVETCDVVKEGNLADGVKESTVYNVVHNDTYGERMDGWIENMSHMITSDGWSGWNPDTFIAGGVEGSSYKGWRSSVIPSDRIDDITDAVDGMSQESGKGKNFKCRIDMDKTANMRQADEVCQTDFDMVVGPNDKWVETAKPCTHVYAAQTDDKIGVYVDEEKASIGDEWCSVILTVGEQERSYYIRKGQPWIGLHLDKWRCVTNKDRGEKCDPKLTPQDIDYSIFPGMMPSTVLNGASEPSGGGFGSLLDDIKERMLQIAIAVGVIVGCILVIAAGVLIFTWVKRKACIETANDCVDVYHRAKTGGGGTSQNIKESSNI